MIRTRFAPSPTGFLHIGGVRTALFNWLFARKHGGQFLLRIDDTDAERNVESALAPILHGFRWLGIDWDEGPEVGGPHAPYYQSQRLDRYQAAAAKLLASGHAYRDFARTEEIQAEREAAEKSKQSFVYSRRWMAETDAQAKAFEAEGRASVVRLKMPREGTLTIADIIRGDVQFDWAREQDHVIQRADGTCLYHLASVVDDFDFEISHVIRAEEHLSNTPRQIFIAQSLGYPLPTYAHLPFVAEPGSKNKLSKRKLEKYLKNKDFAFLYQSGLQIIAECNKSLLEILAGLNIFTSDEVARVKDRVHLTLIEKLQERRKAESNPEIASRIDLLIESVIQGVFKYPEHVDVYEHGREILRGLGLEPSPSTFNPVIVDFYEQVGYLPDAILNYLLLLGWSLDDKTEFFSREEMIQNFSLERVTKAPASFDPKKLLSFQDHYMQALPMKQKVAKVLPYLQKAGYVPAPPPCSISEKLTAILTAAGDRIKVAGDILDHATFFIADDAVQYDEAAFDKRIRQPSDAIGLLTRFRDVLATLEPFDAPTLDKALHDFIAAEGIDISHIIHALRIAVTGQSVGFGVFETMAILGRASCISRLSNVLKLS